MPKCLFKLRAETHYLQHTVAVLASGLNPRFWATWGDETYMGRLTKLCQTGNPYKVGQTGIARYLTGLEFELRRFWGPAPCT